MRRTMLVWISLACVTPALVVGCTQPTTELIDVQARVIDTDGGPRQGLRVRVADRETTTDADGRAAFVDVETPYDLVVARQDMFTLVHGFRGLDASAPQLHLADPVFESLAPVLAARTSPKTATVTVPLPVVPGPNLYAVACLESGAAPLFGCSAFLPATTTFEVAARWYGPTTIDAKLHVVYVQTTAGLPSDYVAHYVGEAPDLTDGSTRNVALSFAEDPAERSVNVAVYPPSALQGTSVSALVRVSDALVMPLIVRFPVTPGATTTIMLPDIGIGEMQIVGRAVVSPCPLVCVSRSVAWRSDVQAGADLDLELATPPQIVSPLDEATDVGPGTPLVIGDTMGGAVTFVALDAFNFVHAALATTAMDAETSLPDPGPLQIPLPPQETYALFALIVPDATSPESWLDGFGPLTVSELEGGPGTLASGSLVATAWRRITTP